MDGVIFNCDFAYLSSGEIFKNRYACRMIEDNIIVEGSMSLVEVNGEHAEAQSNDKVRMVYANKQFGPCMLPKDIKNFFPNIDGIKWVHGSLSTIDADDLDFPNLDILDLLDNKFISLPSDLFKNSPKLQWIQLDSNAIAHVGRNFFDTLTEIKTIRFRSNPCLNSLAETPEDIEDLKSRLPTSCPSGPTPVRCMINEEVNELKIVTMKCETSISTVIDLVDENKQKTDEVKVQLEHQVEQNAITNEKFVEDIEYLKQQVFNQNKTISTLQEAGVESQREAERLKHELIDQSDMISAYRARLEKIENLLKYCQCVP